MNLRRWLALACSAACAATFLPSPAPAAEEAPKEEKEKEKPVEVEPVKPATPVPGAPVSTRSLKAEAKAQKSLVQAERDIARLEGKLNEISDALTIASIDADVDAVARLGAEYDRTHTELDAAYAEGLRRLLKRAVDSPQHFDVALDAAFVLKSLERVGDHARNLARQVRGIVNGTVTRDGLRPQAQAGLR